VETRSAGISGGVRGQALLEHDHGAGQVRTGRISFTADITEARPDAVTLRAELTVDRSRFGMTWSPMRISSLQAAGSITA
jgi:hypothetical protein